MSEFTHGCVDFRLNQLRVGIAIASVDVFDRAVKNLGEYGLLDELREVPFRAPCEPRNERRERSVSRETLMFQRTASSVGIC